MGDKVCVLYQKRAIICLEFGEADPFLQDGRGLEGCWQERPILARGGDVQKSIWRRVVDCFPVVLQCSPVCVCHGAMSVSVCVSIRARVCM